MKRFIKFMLSLIALVVFGIMITGYVIGMNNKIALANEAYKSEFVEMIKRIDRECPIPAAMGKGEITSVKLEGDFMTYYLTYAPDVINKLSKLGDDDKVKEALIMGFLCVNGQPNNPGNSALDALCTYGYGVRFVITDSANGKHDFKVSADEIEKLREKLQMNPHEALHGLISLSIEADRANFPMKLGEGLVLNDVVAEDNNIALNITVDEELYSLENMAANKNEIKTSIIYEGLKVPECHALLEMCKISHTGLIYRMIGSKSHMVLNIEIAHDELFGIVDTPSQLNVK